ncbi:sulfotransferase [Methyloceanibacter sp. wino2]|uniref:sulfotransferase family protein n=1 Tax=Methyloceanibacter sp. wino2 TaxID=2170729 RepID=UPI000D3E541E|nr:sulfotransferase [Methyloceanibacter sp. wino2]
MPQPIFIIGSPRSGTSILTWAIGQHPNIAVQPETNWMPIIAQAAVDAYKLGTARQQFSQLSWAKLPFEDFITRFGKAIDDISLDCFERRVELAIPNYRDSKGKPHERSAGPLIKSADEPKQRWVDGTPEYSFSTYALGLMFPDCKFIHILRRPDQVVNSLAHFSNLGYADTQNKSIANALGVWMRHTVAARDAANYFGQSRLLRIDHADLVADNESVMSRCFEFLGEPNCEGAAALLSKKKINSSSADDERQTTLAELESRSDYVQATELYETLRDSDVPVCGDPRALSEQLRKFAPESAALGEKLKSDPLDGATKALNKLKTKLGH